MISFSDKGNFLVAHYDWIAAGVGGLALLGAIAFFVTGSGVEDEIGELTAKIEAGRPSGATVAAEDMGVYVAAADASEAKKRADYVVGKATGEGKDAITLLSSDLRLLCVKCARATTKKLDADRNFVCFFCGATQEVAKAVAVLDADNDGMPDDWERKYGLDPKDPADADADKDGDDFTNLEEFQAKTDPTDRKDHPDYLGSLTLCLPLTETRLPFVFTKAMKIPAGWRCEFFDAKRKDDYGRMGRTITAVVGEEIDETGYVLKNYKPKESKVAIKGGEGLTKRVDVSEATIERKSDGKQLTLVITASKKAKPVAVDVEATLVYNRRKAKTFTVVMGSQIDLSGVKYKVVEIKSVGTGACVTLEELVSGKKHTLTAN